MSVAARLGIDGGGTSTVAWLADDAGNVLGRGRSGPSNAKTVGAPIARAALAEAIGQAFADAGLPAATVGVACLGLAGFDRPDDRRLLEAWNAELGWARRLVLVNDGALVIAAGTPEGWGLGVIAGTGSIAVGRAADGTTARAGGWGPLIGDEGSAYAVALAGLRLLARRADGRDPSPDGRDALADRLCEALGIDDTSGLVAAVYAPGVDRSSIAALAPSVVAAARDDPEVVPRILEPAGRDLAEPVLAVARSLRWPPGRVPLALAGGFLLAAADVSRSLVAHLARAGYEADVTPVPEPVLGAIVLAGRADVAGSGPFC
jgi:N-acetylglucosamine kinase-like BadF-type ATPase